jgi:hypothetical protein
MTVHDRWFLRVRQWPNKQGREFAITAVPPVEIAERQG